MPVSTTAANVLTVEDDPIVRAELRLVLESAGFEVCADTGDGVEAVELAREHEPDAILLDLGLRRLDGVEATRRILADRDVPIVALTGRSRGLAEQAVEAGAASYLLKPFREEEVVRALRDAIVARERRQSRGAIAEMLGLLGYPEDWSDDLEQRAFARGRVWRRTR
ncbi:MAG: response regulator [Gaiellaceae bacterium]